MVLQPGGGVPLTTRVLATAEHPVRAHSMATSCRVYQQPSLLSEHCKSIFAQRKRPTNVIFYLLFSVGIFVLDMHL